MDKVILDYSNGKTKKGIKIIITTILNNSNEKIWDKLLDIETLIYICKPMARFKLLSSEKPARWEINTEYVFELFIYGFIPFGKHKITFENYRQN
jgi:hypothetical protein